ncbi:hypothetical protein H0H81_004141 [Sphagnurus paluster]|uniref:ABC transporter domain-containing protein n=1 Tax=Sphagnurus paluster TaxID=117069 RepID=A0A9P7FV02_9AGAR|nr:hypothetical protein H0H81_004141 [Sphagnurus paluster]
MAQTTNAEKPTVISKSPLVKQTIGIWTTVRFKESLVDSFKPTHYWAAASRYFTSLPVVRRFVVDVYTLNPPLVLLYLMGKAWKGIEPGITDYIRTVAIESMSEEEFRQDIVNNNLSGYIMDEYSKARKRLGTHFARNTLRELRLEAKLLVQLLRALSGEIPVLYFTYHALKDPAVHTMSSLAILRQQSSALITSVDMSFLMFSCIMQTLNNIQSLYKVRPLILVDGTIEYSPQKDCRSGMDLELKDVSFEYPGMKSGALHDINLHIRAGQLVVIVGENGSGKSTLIKLLSRMYDASEGTVLIDGLAIEEYRLSDLRDAMALLNQEHSIYPVSMGENIGLGYVACATDPEAIGLAAEKGGATEVLKSLDEGLDTVLHPVKTARGLELELPKHQVLEDILDGLEVQREVSGMSIRFGFRCLEVTVATAGEKQRLVAARTFMRLCSPKIKLVAVDEPSSALDPRGELELFSHLRAERVGKMMIFVTHRFGHLTCHADLILCMKNGTIVEAGRHEELLPLNGEYATLYKIQAQAFAPAQP